MLSSLVLVATSLAVVLAHNDGCDAGPTLPAGTLTPDRGCSTVYVVQTGDVGSLPALAATACTRSPV